MVSREWLSLQSWRWQHMDPYWKQAFCPRSNLSQLSLCPCQLEPKLHDLPHPAQRRWQNKMISVLKCANQFTPETNTWILKEKWGNSYPGEGVDVSCFMATSETTLIAFSVSSNVLFVPQLKISNGFLDNFIPSIISHGLGTGINRLAFIRFSIEMLVFHCSFKVIFTTNYL